MIEFINVIQITKIKCLLTKLISQKTLICNSVEHQTVIDFNPATVHYPFPFLHRVNTQSSLDVCLVLVIHKAATTTFSFLIYNGFLSGQLYMINKMAKYTFLYLYLKSTELGVQTMVIEHRLHLKLIRIGCTDHDQ